MTGCVYCGLPRAKAQGDRAGLVELPACNGHTDLLPLDHVYTIGGPLVAGSSHDVALVRGRASATRRERHPMTSQPLAAAHPPASRPPEPA